HYIPLEKFIVPTKNDSPEIIQQIITSISTEEKIEAEHLVFNQYQTWMTKNNQLISVKQQHAAELASTHAQIQKLTAMTD
ncbi:hypothetical protein ABFV54_28265, partial [Pseudomonas syringae]|uniref:hypothetical protein n=1 Tax=Pseudomonas syringae TaxID=317 RepID=UPI0034D79B91